MSASKKRKGGINMVKYKLLSVAALCLIFQKYSYSQPTKEDFLKAWENNLKSKPDIESIEKLSDNKYKIKLANISYPIKLEIFDVTLNECPTAYNEDQYTTGYCEFEIFEPAPDKINQDYRKLAIINNYASLYYSQKTKKWIDANEFDSIMNKVSLAREKKSSFWELFSKIFYSIAFFEFILILIFLVYISSLIHKNTSVLCKILETLNKPKS
jgi:hypothetical protein